METYQSPQKTSVKDFFLNLGAIVALFTVVISLVNILFTAINNAFPQINSYDYYISQSISLPVATLIIFFPIYILLMWLLEKEYSLEPEKRHLGVRKWLTYITLFISGVVLAGDLVTILYYFIDGQELTTGFLLKVFSLFVVIFIVFFYYISDIRNKLTSMFRKIWLGISLVVILLSIIWGFAVLGSPRTQQLFKYDAQKVNDLQNIKYQIENYYQTKGSLPNSLSDLSDVNYSVIPVDQQTNTPYEYTMIGQSAKAYELCATFNKDSIQLKNKTAYQSYGNNDLWIHPAGHYCFTQTIPVSQYKLVPTIPNK